MPSDAPPRSRPSAAQVAARLIAILAERRTLVWVLGLAMVARLGAYFVLRSVFDFVATGAIHGSGAYDTYARNLVSTGVYGLTPGNPDAVLPPMYSLLLAAVYRIAGRGALQVAVVNTALDLLAIVWLRQIGARLFTRGAAIGTLAGFFTACYPYLVFQSLTVIDTSLFIALLYAFLTLAIALRGTTRATTTWSVGVAAGVVAGLAVLTRPVLPPLVALVAVWLAVSIGWRAALARVLPLVLGAAVIVAPWMARNARVLDGHVALSSNAGSNFWQGNNPDTVKYLRAGYDVQWTSPGATRTADSLGPDADRRLRDRALAYLASNPRAIPDLLWTKLLVHWSVDIAPRVNPGAGPPRAGVEGTIAEHVDARGDLTLGGLRREDPIAAYAQPLFDRIGRPVHRAYWGVLFVLGLLGLAITRHRWREISLLWFLHLTLTAVYVIFHPSTRYRVPGDPAWFLFSSAAILWLMSARAQASEGTAAASRGVERPDDRHGAAPATCCWLSATRYAQPLEAGIARKWRALGSIGMPIHVIGFSGSLRPRRFVEHATFHLLPRAPIAVLRYATLVGMAPWVLLWVVLRHDARIVIAQGPVEGAIGAGVTRALRLVGRRVALIVESHGDFERAPFLYRRMRFAPVYRRLMRGAARFALARTELGRAVSADTHRQLRAHTPDLPIEVFPAWVDADTFTSTVRTAAPSACQDLLCAGTLAPVKGIHVLIAAFGRLSPHAAAARLVIAGRADNPGYVEALNQQIAGLDLQGRVRLVGEVTGPELAALMGRARLLVAPSLSEGLPRVVLEAMLTGTPVVGSRVGGIPDVVRHGETGYLVPPEDAIALADALDAAFVDPALDAIATRGQDRARAIASTDAFVDAHRRMFHRVRPNAE